MIKNKKQGRPQVEISKVDFHTILKKASQPVKKSDKGKS